MQEEVQLILKNPSASGEDFSLRVPLSTSISDLKRRIASEHPEKPAYDKQRLIFAGRLLNDNEILSNILRPDQHDLSMPQKFHLVIKRDQAAQNMNRTNIPPQQPVNQPHWGTYPGNYGNHPYHNPYYQQQQQPAYNIPPQQPYNNMAGPWGYQQPHQQPQQQQQQQQQQQPQFYQQQYPGMGVGVGVGVGGPYMQQVHFQRVGFARINIDFSLIMKLLLLVYVLGQGGGTDRFAILIALAIAFYLYQTGMARFQFVRFGGQQQAPAQEGQQGQEGVADVGARQGGAAGAGAAGENEAGERVAGAGVGAQQPENFYQQHGIIGEIMRFFVPLVCSLFPSWQLPENIQPRGQQPPQQQARPHLADDVE